MAERAGFEPAVPCGTQHFQCCTIGHSVTSPVKTKALKMTLHEGIVNAQNSTPPLITLLNFITLGYIWLLLFACPLRSVRKIQMIANEVAYNGKVEGDVIVTKADAVINWIGSIQYGPCRWGLLVVRLS